jgi:hypothetical protein
LITRHHKRLGVGRNLRFHHLQIFGIIDYAWRPSQTKTNLKPKSTKCMFVGYNINSKAYRLVDCAIRKIKLSHDVVFNEITPTMGF